MSTTVFALILLGALAGPLLSWDDSAPVLTEHDVELINQAQDSWIASNEWVAGLTWAKAKALAATQIRPSNYPERNWGQLLQNFTAPESFDSRKQWPSCTWKILNQQQCGSCWAFGATEALSDRLCVDSKGAINVILSPQYLVSCDSGSYGCQGGYLDQAWEFMEKNGVPTWDCVPYQAVDGTCPSTCTDRSALKLYHAQSVQSYSGPTAIQAALLEGGPVETAFTVYQDFFAYKEGIYIHKWGGVAGGHAVKIVGWGTKGDVKYWIVANSWGAAWGLDGYFWIEFGQCGIDSQAVAGKGKL